MEQQPLNDSALDLDNELILGAEPGGDEAIAKEPGVLLLSDELPPEPVIKKIDVGPRVTGFNPTETGGGRDIRVSLARAWQMKQPSPPPAAPVLQGVSPVPAVLATGPRAAPELGRILDEARAFAADYGKMQARTRRALYEALGRTYDLTIRAEELPAESARLIAEAGLAVQDRAPYSPLVKLVFGADYDKTRIAEFAAAIAYGRRKQLAIGTFGGFLEQFEGGLKAVIGLERLIRGNSGAGEDAPRAEARPAIARMLRDIQPAAWDALPAQGDEFALLVARRLPDGRVVMVGEVPRDIALLEKAARKLLAERDGTGAAEAKPARNHPEEV
jgi:hypothetical protein